MDPLGVAGGDKTSLGPLVKGRGGNRGPLWGLYLQLHLPWKHASHTVFTLSLNLGSDTHKTGHTHTDLIHTLAYKHTITYIYTHI